MYGVWSAQYFFARADIWPSFSILLVVNTSKDTVWSKCKGLKTKKKQLLAKYKIFFLAWGGLFVLGDNQYIGFLFHILSKTNGLRMTKTNTFSKVYITESTIHWRKKSFSFSWIGVDIYNAARHIAVVRYEAQSLIKHCSYILLLSYNFIKHSMVVAWQIRSLLHWHSYSSEWI